MNIIRVQGKGRVEADPDQVSLSFQLESRSPHYAACVEELHGATEALRQEILDAGLTGEHLKTRRFTVQTLYRTDCRDRRVFDAYEASHDLVITFPFRQDLLGRVLAQVGQGQSGAQVNVTFSLADSEGLRQRVLARAVEEARSNARTLAAAAGLKLGEILPIDYGSVEVHIRESEHRFELCSLSARSTFGITPEAVSLEDTVTLVYAIG